MSLKSKLSPELRIALKVANAISGNKTEPKPISLFRKLSDSFSIPIVIAVVTGLIGFMSGIGTNFFQSRENMVVWQAQHNIDAAAKLFSIRADLMNSFQDTLSKYFELDAETYVLSNANIFKAAAKIVAPALDVDAIKGMPSFPTVEQIKEHRENWSKLQSLSQSIEIYFGDRIGGEAHLLLKVLNNEPSKTLDFKEVIEYLTKVKDSGKLNLSNLQTFVEPYITPQPHSERLEQILRSVGLDMKCVIRRSVAIERDLVFDLCPK